MASMQYKSDFLRTLHERGYIILFLFMICFFSEAKAAEIHQVVLQKGVYTFDQDTYDAGIECENARKNCPEMSAENDDFWGRYTTAVCAAENKNKCVCDADIVYPIVEREDASETVNQVFKHIAEDHACTAGMGITKLHYEITHNDAHVVSVVFDGYGRAVGGQGSCHSDLSAMTVNTRTGHVYTLDEVLDKSHNADIKNAVTSYFFTYYFNPEAPTTKQSYETTEVAIEEHARQLKNVQRMLSKSLDTNFWNLGFYIKGRQLYVDLNDYILSCANGPSFPIPIPLKYITKQDLLE